MSIYKFYKKKAVFRNRFHIVLCLLLIACFFFPVSLFAFTYKPAGELEDSSRRGNADGKVYFEDMRFPIENAPAYANSQVYGIGGLYGGGGGQCDSRNYSYPWKDNFCESRRWSMPFCPAGTGHQGQDIRPATCAKDIHWAVAAEKGTITNIGSYSITLTGVSGLRHRYLHLNHGRLAVRTGQTVEKGQRIGLVSNNFGGTATTIHLHYDMKSGSNFLPTYTSLVNSYKKLLGDVPSIPGGGDQTSTRAVVANGADFDGNGKDDVFWYRHEDATDYLWYSNGEAFDSERKTIGGRFVPITGDFDGNGLTDIFWYRAGQDYDYIWFSEGRNFRAERSQVTGSYLPVSGDFDGSGSDDIFWYQAGTGSDSVWYSDAGQFAAVKATVNDVYQPIAGDFDGNGTDYIFWYKAGAETDYLWKGRGTTFVKAENQIYGSYAPVVGDYNGDGKKDIFWYAPGATADYIAYSNGPAFTFAAKNVVPIIGSYEPVQGDFNGDGIGDIFWYAAGENADYIYYGTLQDEFDVKKQVVNDKFIVAP